MIRQPPRYTRQYTLFPYTTLCLSPLRVVNHVHARFVGFRILLEKRPIAQPVDVVDHEIAGTNRHAVAVIATTHIRMRTRHIDAGKAPVWREDRKSTRLNSSH